MLIDLVLSLSMIGHYLIYCYLIFIFGYLMLFDCVFCLSIVLPNLGFYIYWLPAASQDYMGRLPNPRMSPGEVLGAFFFW